MTAHGYSAYIQGCRCDVCREANREYVRRVRRERRESGVVPQGVQHGLYSTYVNYCCRCEHCREARRRQRRRESAARRLRSLPDAGAISRATG